MDGSKNLTITILGKNYSIVTDENEAVIYDAARMVDQIMQTILNGAELKDYTKVAVLAALQCAADCIKYKENASQNKIKTGELAAKLEKAL